MTTISREALIAKARAAHEARIAALQIKKEVAENLNVPLNLLPSAIAAHLHVHKDSIQPVVKSFLTATANGFIPTINGFTYNERQTEAIELAMRAKSFCLIGAAGTGKTTTTREVIGQLVKLPHIFNIETSTKYLTKDEPAIVIVAFTKKAVDNIKKFLPSSLKRHCLTIHKLLEFQPIRDPMTNKIIGFGPTYDKLENLPKIACIIWEESSMTGTDLAQMVYDALPIGNTPQEIFLGDLNQLPPIFGPSILGFKLLDLPAVELTEVYRQALESPIITYAHKVREGKTSGLNFYVDAAGKKSKTPEPVIIDNGVHGKMVFKPWKMKVESYPAVLTAAKFFCSMLDSGYYNPATDIILCPFNKSFGTLELNRHIAQKLGEQREEPVFEILARGTYHYFAVGDKVLYDRQEATIIGIIPTAGYIGKPVRDASIHLTRWGKLTEAGIKAELEAFQLEGGNDNDFGDDQDNMAEYDVLDGIVDMDDEEQKNLASHTIRISVTDTGDEFELTAAGEFNKLLFAYVLTVHKSQGSEWNKVFIALHHSHNKMLSRELMYTAITRAKQECFILMDPGFEGKMDSVTWAAKKPQIKGITLQEKAEYFRSVQEKYRPAA